jgi:site-specific recombinase XerD
MKHWVMMSGLDISVTPHWFRHTCAMRIMNNSTSRNPLRMVTAALGHRSINSAMTYTQPSKEEVALALEEAS